MSTTIPLTVGDTGITIKGTITQEGLGGLTDLSGCSVTFSLLQAAGGTAVVNEATAVLGTFNKPASSVGVSYRLKTADVASQTGLLAIRWTLVLADGGKIHAPPGGKDNQVYVQINP